MDNLTTEVAGGEEKNESSESTNVISPFHVLQENESKECSEQLQNADEKQVEEKLASQQSPLHVKQVEKAVVNEIKFSPGPSAFIPPHKVMEESSAAPQVSQDSYALSLSHSANALSFFSLNVSRVSYQPPSRVIQAREFVQTNVANKLPFLATRPFPPLVTLHNINFVARSSKITALLGPAAERKILTELIVGRKMSGITSGDIFMKGPLLPTTTKYFQNVSYVPENPLFASGLTYAELLRFSVRLRMSNINHSAQFVEDRLNDLLTIMDLQKCRNRKIPDRPETKGEIGCDFRRLGIALEIASLPPLIVINEPTLDFDPAISVLIMQCLKNLSARGHAIIVSLTRPYKQELMKIDSVVLLSEGHTIFSSSPRNIVQYFTSPKVGYVLKEGGDVVDFLLDIASGVERPTDKRTADLPVVMQSEFELTEFFDPPQASIAVEEESPSAFDPEHYACLGFTVKESAEVFAYRAYVILERAVVQKFKDTPALLGLIGCILFISCIFGYLFYQQGQYGYYTKSLLGLPYLNTVNMGSLFFFSCALVYIFPSANTSSVVQKMDLFRYEQAAGYCTLPAFYIATVFSEGLLTIMYSTIFASIIFFMVEVSKGFENYLFFVFVLMLMMSVGQSTLFLLVSIFKTERMARDVFLLSMILQIFVSGYCFTIPSLTNDFLFRMAGISPLRWSFEGMMSWKFSFYADGEGYLAPYGFDTFAHYDALEILGNFLLVGQFFFVLSLFPRPNLLDVRKKTTTSRRGDEEEDSIRMSSTASDEVIGVLNSFTSSRGSSRPSELVKPALFVRESFNTSKVPTKLSISVSQTGERNVNKGPTVLFHDITFRVRDPRSPVGYKTILDHVSGQFDWGKLSLILGATESGKSSLIHILAGDIAKGAQITGDVLLDGRKPPNVPLWQRCGLVSAESYHFRDLTVREVLLFAMNLRCIHREAFSVVLENVSVTLEGLHLTEVADKRTKELTPGEFKRLSIAEEMVHGPKLLLLDEPTTGVDLVEQAVLLTTFREMVNQDRTVIASIYHPTVEVFNLFDTLLLLSKGRVIYFGNVKDAGPFFISGPWNFDASHYPNPADFLADLSGGFVATKAASTVNATSLEEYYKDTPTYKNLLVRVQEAKEKLPSGSNSIWSFMSATKSLKAAFSLDAIVMTLWSIKILFQRSVLVLLKRTKLVIGSIALLVLISATFGWVMGDCNNTSSLGVNNVNAFTALASVFIIFTNIQFIFFLYNNRQVYLRENSRGLYNLNFGWFWAAPPLYFLRAINSVIFSLVIYTMIRLDRSSGMYGFFILSFLLFTLCSTLITEVIVFLNDDISISYLALVGIGGVQFIFSGLFLKAGSLPVWMRPFMPSSSVVRWNMQGNILNIYGGNVGAVGSSNNAFIVFPSGYSTYDAYLTLFGWGGKSKWYCLMAIVYYILVMFGLLQIVLAVKSYTFHGGRNSSKQK